MIEVPGPIDFGERRASELGRRAQRLRQANATRKQTGARVGRQSEFADVRVPRGVQQQEDDLLGRNLLLEARFFGLRFYFGVRVTGVKLLAFAVSVGLTAMVGAVWAYYESFIYPQFAFDPLITIAVVLMEKSSSNRSMQPGSWSTLSCMPELVDHPPA